jgi:phosphoribosylglycinamide formyltransferase-1
MKRISVFASGSGTNTSNLIQYFKHSSIAEISVVVTNNDKAGVIDRVIQQGVDCIIQPLKTLEDTEQLLKDLQNRKIDFIVLAGFLKLIPREMIVAYPNKILNIHPALLPKYGGKGMYGMRVHEAVVRDGEKESGITIHVVNEKYDEGQIIFQDKVFVNKEDTPEILANKIHELEYKQFPRVVEEYIKNQV